MKSVLRLLVVLALPSVTGGCAVVTTPVKVAGTAATTTIKTTGSVVSAPFKAAGNDSEE